jgi:hypothetical protein
LSKAKHELGIPVRVSVRGWGWRRTPGRHPCILSRASPVHEQDKEWCTQSCTTFRGLARCGKKADDEIVNVFWAMEIRFVAPASRLWERNDGTTPVLHSKVWHIGNNPNMREVKLVLNSILVS